MTGRRLSIFFSRRAEQQLEEANDWWRANREGSPKALSEDLARALDLISRQPGIGVPAEARTLQGVRRVLLPRVGYFLFYQVNPRMGMLQVLAFWHARRGSNPIA